MYDFIYEINSVYIVYNKIYPISYEFWYILNFYNIKREIFIYNNDFIFYKSCLFLQEIVINHFFFYRTLYYIFLYKSPWSNLFYKHNPIIPTIFISIPIIIEEWQNGGPLDIKIIEFFYLIEWYNRQLLGKYIFDLNWFEYFYFLPNFWKLNNINNISFLYYLYYYLTFLEIWKIHTRFDYFIYIYIYFFFFLFFFFPLIYIYIYLIFYIFFFCLKYIYFFFFLNEKLHIKLYIFLIIYFWEYILFFFLSFFLFYDKKITAAEENIDEKYNRIYINNKFPSSNNYDNEIIFHYVEIKNAFISHLFFLILSLIFRIIYFLLNYIIFIMIFFLKFCIYFNAWLYKLTDIFRYFFFYIIFYFFNNLTINFITFFWIRLDYIINEFFIFCYQLRLPLNFVIISIINYFYKNNLYCFDIEKIKILKDISKETIIYQYVYIIVSVLKKNIKIIFFKIFYIFYNIFYYLMFKIYFNLKKNKYILNIKKVKNIIKNIMKYNNIFFFFLFNSVFFYIGKILLILFIIFFYIFKLIMKIIISKLFKFKIIYFIILFYFIYMLGFDFSIITLPIKLLIWDNSPMIADILRIYIYYDFFYLIWEWLQENNFIDVIDKSNAMQRYLINNVNLALLEWNLSIELTIKRLKLLTFKEIKTFIDPLIFLGYLIYDFQIFWLIQKLKILIIQYIILYFWIKFVPFIYWTYKPYYFLYKIYYILNNILLIWFYLCCHSALLYFYHIPFYYLMKLLYIYYYFYTYYYFFKYYYFYYLLFFFKIIINNLYILFLNLFKLTINILINIFIIINIFINCMNIYLITFISCFLNILIIDMIYIYNTNYLENINLYKSYILIYIYINIYYEIQSNLDWLFSYIRINRYRIYKWTKFSRRNKKSRNRMYLIKLYFGEMETLIYHLEMKWLNTINKDSILRNDSINQMTNINHYIKYYYWFKHNDFQNIEIKKTFAYKYENLILRSFVNYIFYLYLIIFSIFRCFYYFFKNKSHYYNTPYLWKRFKNNFNYELYFDRKYNEILSKYINQYKIDSNSITPYDFVVDQINEISEDEETEEDIESEDDITLDTSNLNYYKKLEKYNKLYYKWILKKNLFFYSFIISKIKKNKYKKFKMPYNNHYLYYINNINIFKKNKILYFKKYLYCFFMEKYNNELLYWKFLKKYKNIYTIIEKHYDYFFIFLSFMYKKNIYAPFIYKQEINIVPELFNANSKYLNKDNIEKKKYIMFYIIQYFENIDNWLYNNKGPSWLLHKNKTTIFLNYKKEQNVEYINICYTIPYEFEYFFFFVIFYIYWSICNIYICNNLSSQPHLNEYYLLLEIIRNNIYFFWILNKILFNIFSFTNYTINPNSIYGIELENNTWSYLWTYKYIKLNTLKKYLNLLFLDNNKINYYKFYIPCVNIRIIYFILIFLISIILLYNIIIKLLKLKKKKLFYKKNNLNVIWSIFTHYKLKYYIWNNYLKNK